MGFDLLEKLRDDDLISVIERDSSCCALKLPLHDFLEALLEVDDDLFGLRHEGGSNDGAWCCQGGEEGVCGFLRLVRCVHHASC